MEIGVIGYGRNNKMELKYRIYCLDFITKDIDEIIDNKPLTYEEFCEKYNEENK